jgi:hypothetical protein
VEAVPRVAFCERQTLHLDRGYDNNGVVRRLVADNGIDDLLCSKGRARGTATPTTINLVRGAVLAMRTTTTATAATSPTTSTTAREYLRISVDKSGRERSPEEQHADKRAGRRRARLGPGRPLPRRQERLPILRRA